MDFAKKQLEKYGWKEGKGLGKNEDGLSTALKPKLKFDKSGVGHDVGKEFTDNWWEKVYNKALSNVEIEKANDEVKMSLKNNNESIDMMSSYRDLKQKKKMNKNLEYGLFIKTSKLTEEGVVHFENKVNESSTSEVDSFTSTGKLNDEELFAACGGRTAHKGARHGLKLSGKLSRIEKQEKMLLKKLQNVSICDEKKDIEKKMKKIAKHKDKNREDGLGVFSLEDDSRSSGSSTTKKKKKKRERKSVSFNETVTEYHTQDLDTSTQSSDSTETSIMHTVIEKSKIKDEDVNSINNNIIDNNISDEGIEQDIESKNITDCDHKSFEEAQCSSHSERLSKAERMLKKKNRATLRFLQQVSKETSADSCKKCNKRKHTDVELDDDLIEQKHYIRTPERETPEQREKKKLKRKRKRERQKQRRLQERNINSIATSLYLICNISGKE